MTSQYSSPAPASSSAPGPQPALDQRAAHGDAEQPDEREPFEPSIVREHGQVRQQGITECEPEHVARAGGSVRPGETQPAGRLRSAYSVSERSDPNAALTAASSDRSSTP